MFGRAEFGSGLDYGVYGETESAEGYGGYFVGRGYVSGNLGVGVTDPTEKVDVAGTIKATGLQLTSFPADGYVLTSDANGVGTWQPAGGGGSSPWSLSGSTVYYNNGRVGVGTSTPDNQLDVVSAGAWAVGGTCTPESTSGYLGTEYAGVFGEGHWGVLW